VGTRRKAIDLGDWNGDGFCDIILTGKTIGSVDVYFTYWNQASDMFTFSAKTRVVNSGSTEGWGVGLYDLGMQFHDIDGDKRVDYLCLQKYGRTTGWLNKPEAMLWQGQIKFGVGKDRANHHWADVNGVPSPEEDGDELTATILTVDPVVWVAPTVRCEPPRVVVFPPKTLPTSTTIYPPPLRASLEVGWTTTVTEAGVPITKYTTVVITTTILVSPITTSVISYSNVHVPIGGHPLLLTARPSVLPPRSPALPSRGSPNGFRSRRRRRWADSPGPSYLVGRGSSGHAHLTLGASLLSVGTSPASTRAANHLLWVQAHPRSANGSPIFPGSRSKSGPTGNCHTTRSQTRMSSARQPSLTCAPSRRRTAFLLAGRANTGCDGGGENSLWRVSGSRQP
jgi:hypothetical protein